MSTTTPLPDRPADARVERYRFCPYCGHPLDPSSPAAHAAGHLVCSACTGTVYLDPKIAACVILEIQRRILLMRPNYGRHQDRWLLPGGFVDKGEQVEQAALRELFEEAGVQTRLERLIGVFSYPQWPVVLVAYSASSDEVRPVPGAETAELGLFAAEDIPWDNLGFQSTRDALRAYIDGRSCQPAPLPVCMPAEQNSDPTR